jgi:serine/threonine protein kinase
MCRLIQEMNDEGKSEQKVYGVLTDYDLSSWKQDLENNSSETSQQCIGTPLYMAQELLRGRSTTHLYRHDLESLFYIMLMTCGRHTFGVVDCGASKEAKRQVVMREGSLPYQKWVNTQDDGTLGMYKIFFFLDKEPIELSSPFEDFRPWLEVLHHRFAKGFNSKFLYPRLQEELSSGDEEEEPAGGSAGGAPVSFDDETLGGRVNYSVFIKPTRYLTGELEGLIIRYETTSFPLPTPIGAVEADV